MWWHWQTGGPCKQVGWNNTQSEGTTQELIQRFPDSDAGKRVGQNYAMLTAFSELVSVETIFFTFITFIGFKQIYFLIYFSCVSVC